MNILKGNFKILIVLAASIFFIASCSDSSNPFDSEIELTPEQEAAISYFNEIALGFEFGNASDVTRRWEQDMRVFIGGNPGEELTAELEDIINELNQLVSGSDFSISITEDSLSSNAYIFFGSGSNYAQIFPNLSNFIGNNFGLFSVRFNGRNQITSMNAYVDIFRAQTGIFRRHLLREEFTQSLGLAKDSPLFFNSIFESTSNGMATEYAPIDKQIIQLLYHPEMRTGLNEVQAEGVLINIIEDVVPS